MCVFLRPLERYISRESIPHTIVRPCGVSVCYCSRERRKVELFIRGKFLTTFPLSTPCVPDSRKAQIFRFAGERPKFSDGVAMTWCAHDRSLLRSSQRERADERPTLSLLHNRRCALSLSFLCLARGKMLKLRDLAGF